jgi:tetratricopeptide (TPR) repeat protein
LLMGRVGHDLGEPVNAARGFEQALRLRPNDRESRRMLIGELLNANRPDRATPWLTLALDEEPDDPKLLGLAARQARDLGKAEEASKLADRALARDPKQLDALLTRARLQLADGHDDRALADLELAVKANPNHLGALQLLSQVEAKLGLSERAARTIERYRRDKDRGVLMDKLTREVSNRPDDPEPHYHLGKAAAEGGQTLLATQCFKAALALDPNYEPAKAALAALQAPSSVVTPSLGRSASVESTDRVDPPSTTSP